MILEYFKFLFLITLSSDGNKARNPSALILFLSLGVFFSRVNLYVLTFLCSFFRDFYFVVETSLDVDFPSVVLDLP